jgi:hypothetical protein
MKLRTECWELKKKGGSLTWRLLRVFFTDGITEEFKTSALYGDVTDSPMKMPTESLKDSKCQLRMVTWPIHRRKCRWNHRGIQNGNAVRWHALFATRGADEIIDGIVRWWSRRQKLIYPLSLDPMLPYFSVFFLISTLPNCKQPAPPPKKKSPSSQQVIYLEVFLSQHPCSDLPTDFYQFL